MVQGSREYSLFFVFSKLEVASREPFKHFLPEIQETGNDPVSGNLRMPGKPCLSLTKVGLGLKRRISHPRPTAYLVCVILDKVS